MRMRSVDFGSIQLIVECAKHGTLMDASDRCHITTSAASRRLRLVEEVLGYPIFIRHFKGLQITEKGQSVVQACRDISLQFEKLLSNNLPPTASHDHAKVQAGACRRSQS